MICILVLFIIGIFGMFGCKAEFHPISTIKLEPVAKNIIAQRIGNRQYLYLFEIGDHEYIGMENTKLIHKVDCKCHSIMEK
jgi:hypothetical protein